MPLQRVRRRVEERRDGAGAGRAVVGARRLELRAVERRTARASASRASNAAGIVGRVDARRQRDDAHVEALRDGELHPAQRRRLAGGVAVEREPQPLA